MTSDLPLASVSHATHLSEILIGDNRQRQEFLPDALQELVTSIETGGLMHAPVLRQLPDGTFKLVAGERRLKAIGQIFQLGGKFVHNEIEYSAETGFVPYTSLGELSELEAEEAELDENLKRKDLTWQETAAAWERLHRLRGNQKLEAAKSAPAPASGMLDMRAATQTIADTAKELLGRSDGGYQDTVRKTLIVAKNLSNPVIAKAKSAEEAFKLLKQDETRKQNVALATSIGKTFTAANHSLFNCDSLIYLESLVSSGNPAQLFDIILSDPPYGMDAQDFGDGAGRLDGIEHHYDDSIESWRALMARFIPLTFAATKPEAHAYLFCDFDNFHELKALMEKSGWYVFRTPLIVHKLGGGRVPLPDRGPRRCYETILYAIKGKKQVNQIMPDVIPCQADPNLGHGAQKPVALFQNLLTRSAKPGDRVFDGFAGTGPILEAANTLKCTAVACELNPEYYAIASKRLAGLKAIDAGDDLLAQLGEAML